LTTSRTLNVNTRPLGVTVVYIVLGSLVALKNFESLLELRDARARSLKPLL
jgi:hypothetical protein